MQRDPRKNKPVDAWIRALASTAPLTTDGGIILPELMDGLAEKFCDRPALISASGCLTYRALAGRSRQYARWALEQNLNPTDVVCLMMPNCLDYAAIWMGVTRAGGVVALINTNLTGDALAHCINVVAPKHMVVDASYALAVAEVTPKLLPGLRIWIHGSSDVDPDWQFLNPEQYPDGDLGHRERRAVSLHDRALHIFTSGTTGLPKAAHISHFRLLEWSHWFGGMMNVVEDDRMYNCLPMYHSTGGVVAIGAMLVNGGSVMIRPGFSASRFWDEVATSECTIFQYIGELCRYLLNQPKSPREVQHRLRLCCGNGMRSDVWTSFRDRFRIPRILEFYASTEGNVSLYNCEEKPGSIGRIPAFLGHRFPVAIIKISDTGGPLRDGSGLCMRCAADESGEAIGKIVSGAGSQMSQFDGYTDQAASDAKVLRDVFVQGDAWFRTGDLMRRDAAGYYYFVDRIGDTFRWKGENVSTAEVEEVISACTGIEQAVVYGVAVPGTEGRAGMAAITVQQKFEISSLSDHLIRHLPEYARPLFVRICGNLQITGTFKANKVQLMRDGFDRNQTSDMIYFYDRETGLFVDLDRSLCAAILSGDARL